MRSARVLARPGTRSAGCHPRAPAGSATATSPPPLCDRIRAGSSKSAAPAERIRRSGTEMSCDALRHSCASPGRPDHRAVGPPRRPDADPTPFGGRYPRYDRRPTSRPAPDTHPFRGMPSRRCGPVAPGSPAARPFRMAQLRQSPGRSLPRREVSSRRWGFRRRRLCADSAGLRRTRTACGRSG